MGSRPRFAFFGTPEIAVPCLERLTELGDVALVVAQPDRPKGRGLALEPPPVKVRALERKIPVRQPTKLKDGVLAAELTALKLDASVVIAYGRILPAAILRAPAKGSVNVHASLLPRWRGAAPIQWAIASGDALTGVCLMEMDEGLDTGAVIARRELAIGPDETAGELAPKLGALGAELLAAALLPWLRGELVAVAQDPALVTHARMLDKPDAVLDFTKTARALHDWGRGMRPWPGSETTLGGNRLKVHQTLVRRESGVHGAPGTVLGVDDGIHVACAEGVLSLIEVQPDGKRRMPAAEFVRGKGIAVGTRLGAEENGT